MKLNTSKWVDPDEGRPVASLWVVVFLAAALAAAFGRSLLEAMFVFRPEGLGLKAVHIVDFAAYYLAIGLSVACVLRRLGQFDWNSALAVCSAGYGLAALPPLVDVLHYGVGGFRYLYGSEVPRSQWGLIESHSMPIGEALALLLVAVGAAAATGLVRRCPWRTLLTLLAGLLIVFWHVYGLPSAARWLESRTMPIGGGGSITFLQVVWLMLLRSCISRPRLHYLWQRLPHLLPWALALSLGAAFSGTRLNLVLPLALCASLIFLALIIENDLCDTAEDATSDWARPYDLLDLWLSRAGAFILLIVLGEELDLAGLCLALFYLTGLLYSLPPVRLKARAFPAMYLAEGFWGGMVVLAGTEFTSAEPQASLLLAGVIGGGFFLVSTVKDRKDVEGDSRCGIASIYTVLLSRNWQLAEANRLVGCLAGGTLLVGCVLLGLYGIRLPWSLGVAAFGAIGCAVAILVIKDGQKATRTSLWFVNLCLAGSCWAI